MVWNIPGSGRPAALPRDTCGSRPRRRMRPLRRAWAADNMVVSIPQYPGSLMHVHTGLTHSLTHSLTPSLTRAGGKSVTDLTQTSTRRPAPAAGCGPPQMSPQTCPAPPCPLHQQLPWLRACPRLGSSWPPQRSSHIHSRRLSAPSRIRWRSARTACPSSGYSSSCMTRNPM
jgi:hypothetical protein